MGGVSKGIHAKRLAQASGVRLELRATGALDPAPLMCSSLRPSGPLLTKLRQVLCPMSAGFLVGASIPMLVGMTPAARTAHTARLPVAAESACCLWQVGG